jgi:carbon storage regulator
MLVLTRKVGDTIVIDGKILVTVTAVIGDRVRLGVLAPPSVRVDRSEVHERRLASSPGPTSSAHPDWEEGTQVSPQEWPIPTTARGPGS